MREHTQKSNRFLLVAAERPVARDIAGNSALRPVMAQPILPGHKKKLRDNCTEVLAGKDLFAIFALAIEASSIAKLLDGALVQLVRMPACHAGGHRFESGTHRKSGERR